MKRWRVKISTKQSRLTISQFVSVHSSGLLGASGCGGGWIEERGSSKCYKFVTTRKVSWAAAQGLCADMGGGLATLQSKSDIVWMKGFRIHHPELRPGSFWIGGYQVDGKWLWKGDLTDTPMLVTDWSTNPYNPDNAGVPEGDKSSQDCVRLYDAALHFTWDDLYCTSEMNFICEKNATLK